jgi:CheY-like chemotaxis protein
MPFTILVIDDDETFLEIVSELLARAGYTVLTAASGQDGLARARSDHPDLILIDYHMPGMTGLMVVQQLKAAAATQRIPVVSLTAATAEQANELGRAGCIGFIPKPFVAEEFLRLVAEVLQATIGRKGRGESRGGA